MSVLQMGINLLACEIIVIFSGSGDTSLFPLVKI